MTQIVPTPISSDTLNTTAENSKTSWPEPIVAYFERLNAKAFEEVAYLFTDAGQLIPPFEDAVEGREAIAQYLSTEANEMTLTPMECKRSLEETDESQATYLVKGKVKTAVFTVNVAWQFVLKAAAQDKNRNSRTEIDKNTNIVSVQVKLLASLKELIKFKR